MTKTGYGAYRSPPAITFGTIPAISQTVLEILRCIFDIDAFFDIRFKFRFLIRFEITVKFSGTGGGRWNIELGTGLPPVNRMFQNEQ